MPARPQPRISIVTPSFNQAQFLDETLRSVLEQGYPNLEYVVVDGGSTDGSVDIIRKHKDRLSWWVSEPDRGQYAAIDKGFAHTSGEIMAWINSDDKYLPWTFSIVADVMTALPQIEWLTSRFHMFWDERGRLIRCEEHPGCSRWQVLRGGVLPGCGWPASTFIQQESTFWRRSLWEKAGARLNGEMYPLAGDFELWMRFAAHAELYYVDVPLGGFRQHAAQQTASRMAEYSRQAAAAFRSAGGHPPGLLMTHWLKKTWKLLRFFQRQHARASRQQGFPNHAIYRKETGGWELDSR